MKATLMLLMLTFLLANCTAQNQIISHKRNSRALGGNTKVSVKSDSIVITGTAFVIVKGRAEDGVPPELKGTWVLQSGIGTFGNRPGNADQVNERGSNIRELNNATTTTRLKDSETHITINTYGKQKVGKNSTKPPTSENGNMHVAERPQLQFYGSNETFSGFTGCNRMAGCYTVNGSAISFSKASASTKMACTNNYNEQELLDALHRVNKFKSTNSTLHLMEGDKEILVFVKTK